MMSFKSVIVLLSALGTAIQGQVQLQTPMRLDEQNGFHVGMDLSASYGAVAVAFSNGTIISVARVEASEKYKKLYAQLAQQERWEPDPPWKRVNYYNVRILGEMITALKHRVQDSFGVKVNSTLVSTPTLPYLYDEDLHASIEYAGLEDMDHTYIGNIFKQPSGAMAGSGIGMCHTYWHPPTCVSEYGQMPLKNQISILYTSNALCVCNGDTKGIYGFYSLRSYPSSMDFTLGYDQRNKNPDESFYWAAVRERIMKGIIGTWLAPRNHTVFVQGDKNAVDDPKFREVLDKAVNDLLWDKPPVHYPDDPEFLAARGAAVILQREGEYTLWKGRY